MTSRVPVAVLAALALIAAGWGGLSRLGLAPAAPTDVATYHGALMVSSFIGTLIGLERAIVMRRRWSYAAPILSASAAVALIVGAGGGTAGLLVAGAALAFLAGTVIGAPSSPGTAIVVMSAGAVAWLVGAVLWWQGSAAFRSMPWWSAFLILTIAAERMELARALRPSGTASAILVLAATTFAAGTMLTLVDLAIGLRIAGAGALVLGLWLALRDRPPAAARMSGLPRFIATAMPLAYAWLAVAAFFMITYDGIPSGLRYDAMVHALFAGFVMSMIFAHGPIVVPAVIGTAIAYRRALYAPLAILEVSVALRVIGDALGRGDVRDAGAIGIALAVVSFMAVMGTSIRMRRQASRRALREVSS
ncbi:MAG TPA: hypothetical protein VFV20_02755 [Candidatus Limnocylindria bacterium]|nr:hypothetical protein [Candidatus Limnocylindria bacterium]